MVQYCPNCGNEVGETDKFCRSCGFIEIVSSDEMQENKHKKHENLLLNELDKSGLLGKLERRVRTGDDEGREIDAIGKRAGLTYIIEATPKLNYRSIGQVYFYEYIYKKWRQGEKTKKAIVCKDSDSPMLFFFCKENDIYLFEFTGNKIVELKPEVV